jgi:outer membrane protein assembly factor BamA
VTRRRTRAGSSRRAPQTPAWLGLFALAAAGCGASIPDGSYGVSSVKIRGTKPFDDEAVKACLATFERERFEFVLGGAAAPQCGVPPFDATRLPVRLWSWPWTDWPVFNQTAFDRDLDRIERWYRARGYYDARVVDADVERDEEARRVDVSLTVEPGEPLLMVRIELDSTEPLDPEVMDALHAVIELTLGEPFDEALYDRSKRRIVEVLHEASYARGAVLGTASVDPVQKIARVAFTVVPGPSCRFGEVTVEGNGDLPAVPILAAAALESGMPFSLSALRDARFAIFGLGPFASVEIEHRLRPGTDIVDAVIRVTPARMVRFGVGVGMSVGGLYAQEDETGEGGFAQWDVHLLGKFEHRNFLGGMRSLRIEDRPRLIFDEVFPNARCPESPHCPRLGNLLTLELRQPAFGEARTTLVARGRWDLGPDPYGGRFLRDDIVVGVGPERRFFEGKLLLSSSVNLDLFMPRQEFEPYPMTELLYLHHVAQLDLRDDPRRTRRGSYFALGVQHGGYFLPSDWDYVRITQDSRGYISLGGGFVLAGRLRLGLVEITGQSVSSPTADQMAAAGPNQPRFQNDLETFGPLRHRLRGGGPNSVRGYRPNELGDVQLVDGRLISGGLRQWEASVELRAPITESLGGVLFVDAGDVARVKRFRFEYPQPSFGLGLRYHTIVGPLRLDFAFAPKALQTIGEDERERLVVDENGNVMEGVFPESTLFGIEGGAVSFTIGESF